MRAGSIGEIALFMDELPNKAACAVIAQAALNIYPAVL
jgi:hypothetical protein